jgi:hypothetical protein
MIIDNNIIHHQLKRILKNMMINNNKLIYQEKILKRKI